MMKKIVRSSWLALVLLFMYLPVESWQYTALPIQQPSEPVGIFLYKIIKHCLRPENC